MLTKTAARNIAFEKAWLIIRNAKGSLVTTIVKEEQYKEKVERLSTYLQEEYDLK
jgi:hypothetical protein